MNGIILSGGYGIQTTFLQAFPFVIDIEEPQGVRIGSIEDSYYRAGCINADQLRKLGQEFIKSGYGLYLLDLLED